MAAADVVSGFKLSGGVDNIWAFHDIYGPRLFNNLANDGNQNKQLNTDRPRIGTPVPMDGDVQVQAGLANIQQSGVAYLFNPTDPYTVWPVNPANLAALQTWLASAWLGVTTSVFVDTRIKGN